MSHHFQMYMKIPHFLRNHFLHEAELLSKVLLDDCLDSYTPHSFHPYEVIFQS